MLQYGPPLQVAAVDYRGTRGKNEAKVAGETEKRASLFSSKAGLPTQLSAATQEPPGRLRKTRALRRSRS